VLDIVAFVVNSFQQTERAKHELPYFVETESGFLDKTVGEIIDLSKKDPWCPVYASVQIHALMDIISFGSIHRVPIVDKEGNVLGIVSQSRVVEFISENISALGERAQKTITDLLLRRTNHVIGIKADDKAFHAFTIMKEQGISGIAVLNPENGKLVGNISASDIRGSYEGSVFVDTNVSVKEYMEKLSNKMRRIQNVIYCVASDTVETVVKTLSRCKIHRVYVVDEDMVPIGVISLCDVIQILCR